MKKIIILITLTLISISMSAQSNWFNFRNTYFNCGAGAYIHSSGKTSVEMSFVCCGLMVDLGYDAPVGIHDVNIDTWPASELNEIKVGYLFPIFNNNKFILRAGPYWTKNEYSYGYVDGMNWYLSKYGVTNTYNTEYVESMMTVGGKITLGFHHLMNFEAYVGVDKKSISIGILVGIPFNKKYW